MRLICGPPRNGTSALCMLHGGIIGFENILGWIDPTEELPQPKTNKDKIYKYISDKINSDELAKERADHANKMNPKGFYETPFSMGGINYSMPAYRHILKELLEDGDERAIKVISSALLKTNPAFVDSIAHVIRHPLEAVKSQESVLTPLDQFSTVSLKDRIVDKSPRMYLSNLIAACKFFEENPKIPKIIIHHKEMMLNPKKVVKDLCEFYDLPFEESWEASKDIIDISLYRSKPYTSVEGELWDMTLKIYELFIKEEFSEILEITEDPEFVLYRKVKRWYCTRLNKTVNPSVCNQCTTNKVTRDNFIHEANRKEIDWKSEPCAYECGLNNTGEESKSIEESIATNHWL